MPQSLKISDTLRMEHLISGKLAKVQLICCQTTICNTIQNNKDITSCRL